ncbi:MAG: C4-type zinc ribbon domain-containing protein [Deltaproteobacteria bacterium]|jgi:predicted  nucleic acid-binding Zn-ribbon protein|nr:C4-type zinc ribbon domain-containing protein [Deltaproteobacteria bacterium]
MENTIVQYLKIQKIDLDSLKMLKVLDELPTQIQQLNDNKSALEEEISLATQEINNTKERISVLEQDLKKLKELNENNVLRGKKARNQREYKAFEKDAKTIETKTKETEDKYLFEMGVLSELEQKFSELEQAFPQKEKEITKETNLLKDEMRTAKEAIDKSDEEKRLIFENISPENVALYMKASEGRQGRALAAVEDSVCLACHINIPPQLYNELYKNDRILHCPHCHRIMYIRKNPLFGYVPEEEIHEVEIKPKKRGRKSKKDL